MPSVAVNDGIVFFNMQNGLNISSPLWQPPQNPYPLLHNPPPPAQPPQKVFLLDCTTCGLFLTNRGMKAVLLLRPDIDLYSTDAFPVNCSARSLSEPSRSSASRTCDCLTQTISCHGCGSNVGYMIVSPCARCTSSINITNRCTNGHRFVFHAGEVVGSERHYVQDEPGVFPYHITPFHIPNPNQIHRDLQEFIQTTSLSPPHLEPAELHFPSLNSPFTTPPLADTPLFVDLSPGTVASSRSSVREGYSPYSRQQADSFARPRSPYHYTLSATAQGRSHLAAPGTPEPYPPLMSIDSNHALTQTERDAKLLESSDFTCPTYGRRRLNAGDILSWHHLLCHGEIPGVKEDPRARRKDSSAAVWCCR